MTFYQDNRLKTFNLANVTIDNDGNLTYGPGTNNTFGTYTYDPRNRLTSAGGITYGHDPANNRVSLVNGTNDTIYVIDPASSQVLMRITGGLTNYYIYGKGLLYEVDETATATTVLYYYSDVRGSTIALTDANGNLTDQFEYSPYGMMTYHAGTNTTPLLYNGQFGVQTDPNGLLFMRARYYNPYISRFLNPDPSGFGGGLNFYAFCNGNPISETDPFGLCAQGQNASPSWIQGGYNVLYTGQWSPGPGVYDAAVDAAADYILNNGGVRGFYRGIVLNGKQPGTGSIAAQGALSGSWTVDSGFGSQLDVGAGLQERGFNGMAFTSQTVGVGGTYQFFSQNQGGFQLPSASDVQFPAIYGGTVNKVGGASFAFPVTTSPVALGINYGVATGGILIDPTKVWQNFEDSYNVITGTSASAP